MHFYSFCRVWKTLLFSIVFMTLYFLVYLHVCYTNHLNTHLYKYGLTGHLSSAQTETI